MESRKRKSSCGRLSEQEESLYTGFFNNADTNRDGYLSPCELGACCERLGFQVGEQEVEKLFRGLDSDESQLISLEEFINKMPNIHPERRQCALLRQIFKTVDTDGDGCLTVDELRQVLLSSGRSLQMSKVEQLVDGIDKNKDGKLDYEAFLKVLVVS